MTPRTKSPIDRPQRIYRPRFPLAFGKFDLSHARRGSPRISCPSAMPRRRDESSYGPLIVIAIFKLFKAALLIALGLGLHHLIAAGPQEVLVRWAHAARADPQNRFVHAVIAKVTGLSERQLHALSVGTFLYAAVFLTEGVGLLLRFRWAEYLTVISTAGLLPVEVYELFERPRPVKGLVLVLNVAIVVYLVRRLIRTRPSALNAPPAPAAPQAP